MKYFQLMSSFRPEIKYVDINAAPIKAGEEKSIPQQENIIHFCINTGAELLLETQGKTHLFNRGDVVVLLPDRSYVLRLSNEKSAMINTLYIVGVEMPQCYYARCDAHQIRSLLSGSNKAEARGWVLLPEHMHLSGTWYTSAEKLMRAIVSHYADAGTLESEHVLCIAKWFELIAVLDQCVREQVCHYYTNNAEKQPHVEYYVHKTKKYIEGHYAQRITVPIIAKSVGVSPNYLSAIFKKGTGDTIVSYVNYFRMLRLQELLQNNENQNLGDICCLVGIDDERYARRLFKKYFGVSVRHYKQQREDTDCWNIDLWENKGQNHSINDIV